MSLSDALGKHTDVFPALSINLIHAGEVSGGLQHSITFIADSLEKDYILVSKIKGAMYYPAFVLGVAGIIGFIVIAFIVPKITVILKDFSTALPWYTVVIMAVSDFFAVYWWTVVVLVATLGGSFNYYIRTSDGRRAWDEQVFVIPIVG